MTKMWPQVVEILNLWSHFIFDMSRFISAGAFSVSLSASYMVTLVGSKWLCLGVIELFTQQINLTLINSETKHH